MQAAFAGIDSAAPLNKNADHWRTGTLPGSSQRWDLAALRARRRDEPHTSVHPVCTKHLRCYTLVLTTGNCR
jgi:hypothetical protein